jgi:hypothetical protein
MMPSWSAKKINDAGVASMHTWIVDKQRGSSSGMMLDVVFATPVQTL